MRYFTFLLFLATIHILTGASTTSEESLRQLDILFENRDSYFQKRVNRIDSLKTEVRAIPESDHERLAGAYHKIFNEYASFQGDSALRYARLELEQALHSNNADDIARARTDLVFTHLSSGNFAEAVDFVKHTDLSNVSPDLKAQFYYTCIRLFTDLSDFSSNAYAKHYTRLATAYGDSVKAIAAPDSYIYQYALAFGPQEDNSPKHRLEIFRKMLRRDDIDIGTKAMYYSILADAFRDLGMTDSLIIYKANAARLDVLAAKRETIATLDLGAVLYQLGDIDRAHRYINFAKEDADYYNSRNRKVQIMALLPMVESARFSDLDSRHRALRTAMILIIVLAALLLAAIILIFRQLSKTRKLRAESEKRGEELKVKNAELQDLVSRLEESNQIRDEYVGYGFSIHADYIRKIESFYNIVDRKLMAKQYDELHKQLKRSDIRHEKDEMHSKFDSTFLRLFPDFIEKWIALFPEGEARVADGENALTPEMRIFALIRLGITDTNNISVFLGYSVNTINTYKTKAKNRSHVPNELFEQAIMEIGIRRKSS